MADSTTPEPTVDSAAVAPAPELEAVVSSVLWTGSSDGLALVDADGVIRATNTGLDKLLGYGPGELVGRPVEVLVPDELRDGHATHREGFEARPAARPMAASRLLEALRADGTTVPVNVSLGRLPTAEGELSLAAVRDLTDRVAAEAQAAESDRRRALAEDHDRIASDLHDTVIQRLFGLGLGLQSLLAMVEDPALASRLSEAVDGVDQTIAEIRGTIFGLRQVPRSSPSPLRTTVVTVVAEAEGALGFAPEVRFAGPVDDVDDAEVIAQVGPVVREALSNVARHAGATTALVAVSASSGQLRVTVEDDGRGPPPPDTKRSGLANLADRAVALKGAFQIEARSGGGTVVRWVVPSR